MSAEPDDTKLDANGNASLSVAQKFTREQLYEMGAIVRPLSMDMKKLIDMSKHVFVEKRGVPSSREHFVFGNKHCAGVCDDWKKTGNYSVFDAKGTRCLMGPFLDGLMHGTWIWYDSNGRRTRLITFKAGKRDGLFVNDFRDNTYREEGRYIDGSKMGIWTMKDKRGRVREEWTFDDGVLHGPMRIFNTKGHLTMKCVYVHGVRTEIVNHSK